MFRIFLNYIVEYVENPQFLSVAFYLADMLLILAYLDGSRILRKRYITLLTRGLIEKKEPVLRHRVFTNCEVLAKAAFIQVC